MWQMPGRRANEQVSAATAEDFAFSNAPTPQALYFETGVAFSLGLAAALIAELFFTFG